MNKINLSLDEIQNVLYVKYGNKNSFVSSESPNDGYLILNFDCDKNIIGLQILDFSELILNDWKNHPDRKLIPDDLFKKIIEYINN